MSQEQKVCVNTHGGALTGQADTIRLAAARALCTLNPENSGALKAEGHLTRTARGKERRKGGWRKARKEHLISKR